MRVNEVLTPLPASNVVTSQAIADPAEVLPDGNKGETFVMHGLPCLAVVGSEGENVLLSRSCCMERLE